MTLGGLALAVGILVDDATVTIENINYHLEHGEDVEEAILNGAHEIAVPAFVSTLAICIVFVPMFMLVGIARYLFVPLAEAVVFAMLASYVLSRTLVPTLAKYWLQKHDPHAAPTARGRLQQLQLGFRARLRARARALQCAAGARPATPAGASPCRSWLPWRLTALLGVPVRPLPARARPGLLSRASTPGRSSCTCAPRPARASMRPRRCATAWKPSSARSSRRARSRPSSTTSACPTAASTSPTRPPRRSGREMRTSS